MTARLTDAISEFVARKIDDSEQDAEIPGACDVVLSYGAGLGCLGQTKPLRVRQVAAPPHEENVYPVDAPLIRCEGNPAGYTFCVKCAHPSGVRSPRLTPSAAGRTSRWLADFIWFATGTDAPLAEAIAREGERKEKLGASLQPKEVHKPEDVRILQVGKETRHRFQAEVKGAILFLRI